ncbi:nucleoplasmin-2 [Trichosurus vulpecula]|uniref:nucleoplasmin-2 n=1 Tax=Trichosurus vulpecula TaxID=9337 RepID=UPI00186B2FC4|nr:nucleoplasmin-2 [Trichosurus vulpecula]
MPPTGVSSKAEKSLALFWGCELNWDNRSYTFDPLEDDKTGHKLMLNVICIGEKNNNDVNVVEIVPPPDEDGRERRALPIATLKLSVLPMANISGMELTPPITFHLRSGSGPVYISGRDLTVNLDPPLEKGEGNEEEAEEDAEEEEDDDYDDDDEDDDDGDDDNDDDDDDSNERSLEETPPPKPAKRRASNTQAGGVAKSPIPEEPRNEGQRQEGKEQTQEIKAICKRGGKGE